MPKRTLPISANLVLRIIFGALVFAVLLFAIVSRPTKWLSDFDQSFYLTIAYDLDRHGVFSNGTFDGVDSTVMAPPPGMFFAPAYPWLVLAAIKLDAHFAAAVACAVESNHGKRDGPTCDVYALPIHIMHALFLALGVIAIGVAAALILGRRLAFFIAGLLATAALALEAEPFFSYIMTESVTFSLYSLMALAAVAALKSGQPRYFAAAGAALGLLCLTRPSYLVLGIAIPVLCLLSWRLGTQERKHSMTRQLLAFGFALSVVLAPWLVRNAISVGKFGFTEEYGSASLIERFAYDQMTATELLLAFPYCVPVIGPRAIDGLFGPETMARFDWHAPHGFFRQGRARRDALTREHGRLDPIIGDLVRDELSQNWWRYAGVSFPLAWCGLWVAQIWSVFLLPVFAWACVESVRRAKPLFLLYAAPAIVMVGVHAAVANHYTRYNLGLIGPMSVAGAWFTLRFISTARTRWEKRSARPNRLQIR